MNLTIRSYPYTDIQIEQLKELAGQFSFEFDTTETRKIAESQLSALSEHFIQENRDKKINEILNATQNASSPL
jgi:hypothetical protein